MSESGYLEVKNWREFQHYSDRDPKWIKLYRRVLGDYEFSRLQDASKLLLVCVWLLASEDKEHKGRVPNDPEWIARRSGIHGPIDLQPLIDAGFLLLARRKHDASKPPAKRLPRERDRDRDIAGQKATWLTPFGTAWEARCGNPPFGRLAKCLAPLRDTLGEPEALARWTRYLAGNEPRYCSPERFLATHAAYAGPETCEMTDDFGRMVLHTKRDGWWGYERDGQWVQTVEVAKVSA